MVMEMCNVNGRLPLIWDPATIIANDLKEAIETV